MADVKISELTALTTPDGAEELVVNDSGTTKKITVDNITQSLNHNGATKLTTTSTGVDVTGTVTADGLTVESNGAITPRITSSDGLGDAVLRFYSGASYKGQIGWDQTTDTLGFYNAGSSSVPKALIDSSGNLLVGKTTTNFGSQGVELQPDRLWATSSQSASGFFNRLVDDGEIAKFYKDGTTVGSWMSRSSLVSTIILDPRAGGGGLSGTTGRILPTDNSGNLTNGLLSLGSSTSQYNTGHFANGIYLGGTAAANKLDDYEEGTFTPVITGLSGWSSSPIGYYTKVGNTVDFWVLFVSNTALTGTATYTITGMPFASSSNERGSNVSISRMFGIGLTNLDYTAGVSQSEIQFSSVNGNNTLNDFTHTGSTLRFTCGGTYQTAA